MALKLDSFEDSYGNTYTDSYSRVVETNLNYDTKSAHITINIYKDEQARIDGKQPVAQKTYDVTGDDFETYYNFSELDKKDVNTVSQSYLYIKRPLIVEGEETNIYATAIDA